MKNVKKLIQGGNLVTELLNTAKAYSETRDFKDGHLVTSGNTKGTSVN